MTCHTCHSVTATALTCTSGCDIPNAELSHLALDSEGNDVTDVPQTSALDIDPTLALLTVEEAARRLGIGRTSCYRLITSGELESVTVGRLRKVPADAVPEYVTRLRKSTRAAAPHAA